MSFVLDASVALAWCFDDDPSGYADRMLDALLGSEAIVPSLWTLEVPNGIVVAERRRRIDEKRSESFVRTLLSLPIAVDPGTRSAGFRAIRRLARAHGLSVYEATYLELAQRMVLPLATIDGRLRAAAEREGVPAP